MTPGIESTSKTPGQNGDNGSRMLSDGEAMIVFCKDRSPEINSVDALFAVDALKKNRPNHNVHWYVRELVQNWVDANPQGHNLNGVNIVREDLANGKTRFVISGGSQKEPWTFEDFRPLTGLSTDKSQLKNSAGGFGVGLKETYRDMMLAGIIDRPKVIGEGWSVTYDIPTIEEVNKVLVTKSIAPMKKEWFVAEQRNLNPGEYEPGTCSYVIETDNAEFIEALSNFRDYAPHTDHIALANSHYQREGVDQDGKPCQFKIKWLNRLEDRGNLFIQGQPWSYQNNGSVEDGFFQGAHGVTLEIGESEPFDHGIDREEIDSITLAKAVSKLLEPMTREELEKQLVVSSHIWQGASESGNSYNSKGALVLLNSILRKLRFLDWDNQYKYSDLQSLFPDKEFIVVDKDITPSEIEQLKKSGKIICPDIFTTIDVPKYHRSLELQARTELPSIGTIRRDRESIERNGGQVESFLPNIRANDTKGFFQYLKDQLGPMVVEICINELGEYELVFDANVKHDLLSERFLANITDGPHVDQARLVSQVRNVIHWGLKNKILESPCFSAQGKLSTYTLEHNPTLGSSSLCTKVNNSSAEPESAPISEKQRLSFNLSTANAQIFQEVFDSDGRSIQKSTRAIISCPSEKVFSFKDPFEKFEKWLIGGVAAAVVAGLGGFIWHATQQGQDAAPNYTGDRQASHAELDPASPLAQVEEQIDQIQRTDKNQQSHERHMSDFEYRLWNDTGRYGQPDNSADYREGRDLADFVNNFYDNGVEPIDAQKQTEKGKAIARLKSKLSALQDGEEHPVEDFDIIKIPPRVQIEQIEILRNFMHECTGIKDTAGFFIFTGKGVLGRNFNNGESYGLHQELFDEPLAAAIEVLAHEMGHNFGTHDEPKFYNTMQALLGATIDRLLKIARTPENKRTEEDRRILELQEEWNLRAGIPNQVNMRELQSRRYLAGAR